ncbi:Abhydrolase-3 domain-containing protein [Mycena sanguinolenta]|uniref:Abhydrolase-3 domain-containing protein n=1 Tax=Mycena sanguinolenta TaxID=230812 RepID=A0A8H6Y5H3_9AGAR|nr:Abhydrolase-3 domain-containing protein [Mycena sanguinolenta]
MASIQRKYADLPWYGALGIVAAVIPLPFVLLWTAIVGPYTPRNKGRSTKRIVGERAFRYAITNLGLPQLQFAFGTTMSVYEKWTKQKKLSPVIDKLGDGARLLWIGPKRVDRHDRVVLYLHGGCFLLPLTDFGLDFWQYVKTELEKKNVSPNLNFGVAILEYSLAPAAMFPTPLKQACLGLKFLFDAGVEPGNLQIAGDSAGGNLALQLVSQMLHPRAGLPRLTPLAPIRGLCLLSPWTSLTADTKSCKEFDGIDTMTRRVLRDAGAEILPGFPDDAAAFAEPAKAPESWFHGVDGLFERVLVTAGEFECMRDDIVQLSDKLKKGRHPDVELVIQDGGLHDDMFLDFMVKEKKLGPLTPLIIDWLYAGFASGFAPRLD